MALPPVAEHEATMWLISHTKDVVRMGSVCADPLHCWLPTSRTCWLVLVVRVVAYLMSKSSSSLASDDTSSS